MEWIDPKDYLIEGINQMAQNVVINGVTYQAVPSITVAKAGGGNSQFFDTSASTANPSNTMAGVIGYNANGQFEGQLTVVSVSQDATTKVLTIS